MTNEQIPSKIWQLKNILVERINVAANSNNLHEDYVHEWKYLSNSMQTIGKQIEELIKQYKQPKED